MKKIIVIIAILLLLSGCTNKCNNCKDIEKNEKLYLTNVSDVNVKITGLYDTAITGKVLKNLTPKKLTFTEENPLYKTNSLYVGYDMITILKSLNIKLNFNNVKISNNDTYVNYTAQNFLIGSYLIFYENGYELEKPKLVKLGALDIYWIDNLDSIDLSYKEVED